jgi:NAD(P)-dependent dehydrogenase (short-subunit alcohol dehydrogenase family)
LHHSPHHRHLHPHRPAQHHPAPIPDTLPHSTILQLTVLSPNSGANTGIGLEIVKALLAGPSSSSRYQILLASRDIHKGEDAAASLGAPPNLNPIQLDLSSDASIHTATMAIQQHFGKLDILINNAGTTGIELPKDGSVSLRERGAHIYDANVLGTTCLTESLLPLLSRSPLPKIIFVGSGAGSIAKLQKKSNEEVAEQGVNFWYGSSKSAVNYLTVYYAKMHPEWKVNCVCPGLRATKINTAELREETEPRLGAVRVLELVKEGPEGASGTFSDLDGPVGW